jgi:hypothetical protein
MDPAEEEYFNIISDDEELEERRRLRAEMSNGNASSLTKPLVDYPDYDDDEAWMHEVYKRH